MQIPNRFIRKQLLKEIGPMLAPGQDLEEGRPGQVHGSWENFQLGMEADSYYKNSDFESCQQKIND